MAARCGLTPNLLANTASKRYKNLTDDLWQKVIYIKEKTDSEIVHGGVVALAILQQNPHCETILAHMHVDEMMLWNVSVGIIVYRKLLIVVIHQRELAVLLETGHLGIRHF